MAYNWYQTHAPGWGTQQCECLSRVEVQGDGMFNIRSVADQFGPPPSPGYLTSPSCKYPRPLVIYKITDGLKGGGRDYYRAHVGRTEDLCVYHTSGSTYAYQWWYITGICTSTP